MSNLIMGNGNIGSGLFGLGLFGSKDKGINFPTPPSFITDQNYTNEQNFLKPYGQGLLTGDNIPDFYKSIGMQDSPDFEKMLELSNRDITNSAAEAAARSGTGRGGQLPQTTSQAIADNTSKLRYADFLSANQGKQFLMTTGRGISEGVRNAGQNEADQQNLFNLKEYGIANDNAILQNTQNNAEAAATGKMLGTIAGGVGGFFLGGPAGAAAGAGIGSNLFGGGGSQGTTSSIADLFKMGRPGGGQVTPGGVSDVGKIAPSSMSSMSTDDLMKYFNLN